ncbi:RNA-binding component of cleavage and polyadenylation factor [Xylographa parallela]|nr:RNA-binding component of cleavage and polyadenylation factor [Xylographa parallela]
MAVSVDRGIASAPVANPIAHNTQPAQPKPQYNFAFADFLKREYRFGLDPSRPYCKAFREGHCPLGHACPDKHQTTHSFNNLVCKHWLRGLCKKGDQCEFLHEYNLRRMPECNHYTRSLYCPNGEECLYLHVDPAMKLPPCPHYEKGFCPMGPQCSKKHVRKTICKFYLVGFCPSGRQCKEGAHPRWPENLPKPTIKVEKTPEELELEKTRIREEGEREEEREWERRDGNRRDGRGRGARRPYGQRRRGGFDR